MKNNEILLDVIGEVDEKLIAETIRIKKRKNILKIAFTGIGVCAAVVAGAVFFPSIAERFTGSNIIDPPPTSEREIKDGTEKINAARTGNGFDEELDAAICGFEDTILAYSISDLENGNPWTEDAVIEALPVYRNISFAGDSTLGVYLSKEELEKEAQNAAEYIGTEIIKINANDCTFERSGQTINGTYDLWVKCSDDYCIIVNGNGILQILNDNGIEVPKEYSFTLNGTTEKQAKKALNYLIDKYNGLMKYKKPMPCSFTTVCEHHSGSATLTEDGSVFSTPTKTNTTQDRTYIVYDQTGDLIQDIVNYSLSYTEFFTEETDNSFYGFNINDQLRFTEYIGDYPIITAEQAKKKLLEGKHILTIPYSAADETYFDDGIITESDIAKVELIYSNDEEFYQPYYKFYVESSRSKAGEKGSLKEYVTLFLPAVEEQYFETNTTDDTPVK